jgi:hypothetical protein
MILLITVLITSVFIDQGFTTSDNSQDTSELFIGVDVAYSNLDEIYNLIDEGNQYTNFFAIMTTELSYNETKLLETCQYLYDRDIYFIIYPDSQSSLPVISDIEKIYGDHFLGVYSNNSAIISSRISCEVSSSNITLGNPITISGSINPTMLANVTLHISTNNGTTWNYLITFPSNSDGNYTYSWTPTAPGSYELKASFEEENATIESTSTNMLVIAPETIPTTISYSVSSSLFNEGDLVYVSGFIDPAISGKIVTFNLKRPDGVTLQRKVTTDINGFFYDLITPHGVGYWSITAVLNEEFRYPEEFIPEQSFKVTNPIQELLELPLLTKLIIGTATASIIIITLLAWFITRPLKPSTTKSAVKAHLLGHGNGELQFIDNIIRFHLEKGRLRKQTEVVREIPMAYIESMIRTGNKLSIIWKGVMDTFIIEEGDLTGTVFEMMPQLSIEQRIIFEDKEIAKKKWNELISMLSMAMETIDSLFDILRSLHGWIDWDRVEGFLKLSEENAARLTDQEMKIIELDFSPLSSAIKERLPEETSKETYNLLKLLYDYFSALTKKNETFDQIHPNFHNAKTIILAYYLLNDIKLGMMVGDRVEKEVNELVVMLKELSKNTNLNINIDALKDTIDKKGVDQEKESVFEESRTAFRKQLDNLKKPESSLFIKPLYPTLKPSTLSRVKKFFRLVRVSVWRRVRVFWVSVSKRERKVKL